MIEILEQSLKEYLDINKISFDQRKDLFEISIKNLKNEEDFLCSFNIDFSILNHSNVIYTIGYFWLHNSIPINKAIIAVNWVNHYAVNFNCSIEKPNELKNSYLVAFKFSHEFYSNEEINFNFWDVFYRNIKFIALSLFNLFNKELIKYSFFDSKEIIDFISEAFLDYIVQSLENFKQEHSQEIFGIDKESVQNILQYYENWLKTCDKYTLEKELDKELDNPTRDERKLKLISKYLKEKK